MDLTAVHAPADAAWTIQARGHTPRGWPWFTIRKRGGQMFRVTVHGASATPEDAVDAIAHAVASRPSRPGPWVF